MGGPPLGPLDRYVVSSWANQFIPPVFLQLRIELTSYILRRGTPTLIEFKYTLYHGFLYKLYLILHGLFNWY